MTENKTVTVELTLDEIGALVGAAYSYKGESSEKMIAAAMKLIEAQLNQAKQN